MAPEKILVVDDDAKILKIVSHCLSREGFAVITAADGEDAILKTQEHNPDLIVLDLMLPKIDGLDVCKTLIAENNIPILILSAKGDELDRIAGFRLGVDDYLAKPFSPTELCLRVQAVLRRVKGREPSNSILRFGSLTIDARNHCVHINNTPVELTAKEFDLLFLMASTPRQVFTRMQLLNKIWQSNHLGDEQTVTVHIRRLRKKIEEDSSMPRFIKTVWGVGYKFSAEK